MIRIETCDIDTDQMVLGNLPDYLVAIRHEDGTEHGDFFLEDTRFDGQLCYIATPAIETDEGWIRDPDGEPDEFAVDTHIILIY